MLCLVGVDVLKLCLMLVNFFNCSVMMNINHFIFSIFDILLKKKHFKSTRMWKSLVILHLKCPVLSLWVSFQSIFSPKKRTKHRREIIAARGPFSPVSWRGQTHSSQTQKIRQSGGLGRKNLCGHTKLCVKFWHAAINFRREGNKGAGPISPAHL